MDQWRSWQRGRQEERLLAVRGARHLRSRRLGASLAAWGWWMQRRREGRKAQAVAEAHRRSSLLGWALGAMARYRDLRRAKAGERAEAGAMYVVRLQREAAARWLEVGLSRRAQRLHALAQIKVRGGRSELLAW